MRIWTAIPIVLAASTSLAFDYNGAPAGYAWGTAETGATIALRVTQNWRPTSIETVTPGSTASKYKVVYVKNEGSHLQTCKFVYNQTPAQLNALRGSGWRVEDLAVLKGGSDVRVSAILIRNVTNPKNTLWFRDHTTAQLTTLLGSTYRLLDLERDGGTDSNPRFAGVVIDNTGANKKPWGWMPNHTFDQVKSWANANNMRVIDLQNTPNDKYCAVFVRKAAGDRTQMIVTSDNAFELACTSLGMRMQTLNQSLRFTNRYTGIAVNNVNTQTARIADRIYAVSGEYRVGAYVSQVGGGTPVFLRADQSFYPASAIKVLIHARALKMVPLNELETYKIGNRKFKDIDQNMMYNSNNPDTFTLNSHFGTDAINAYGRNVLGTTTATWIASHYGNAPPAGEFNAAATLVDMGNIYRNVSWALGTTKFAKFREWMLNDSNSSAFTTEFANVKAELGLSTTKFNNWKSKVTFMLKAGNYGEGNRNVNFVNCGRISLPHKSGSSYQWNSFVFGHFVELAYDYKTSTGWSISANMLNEQIKASMNTFK
jgi:hypothetical protein